MAPSHSPRGPLGQKIAAIIFNDSKNLPSLSLFILLTFGFSPCTKPNFWRSHASFAFSSTIEHFDSIGLPTLAVAHYYNYSFFFSQLDTRRPKPKPLTTRTCLPNFTDTTLCRGICNSSPAKKLKHSSAQGL